MSKFIKSRFSIFESFRKKKDAKSSNTTSENTEGAKLTDRMSFATQLHSQTEATQKSEKGPEVDAGNPSAETGTKATEIKVEESNVKINLEALRPGVTYVPKKKEQEEHPGTVGQEPDPAPARKTKQESHEQTEQNVNSASSSVSSPNPFFEVKPQAQQTTNVNDYSNVRKELNNTSEGQSIIPTLADHQSQQPLQSTPHIKQDLPTSHEEAQSTSTAETLSILLHTSEQEQLKTTTQSTNDHNHNPTTLTTEKNTLTAHYTKEMDKNESPKQQSENRMDEAKVIQSDKNDNNSNNDNDDENDNVNDVSPIHSNLCSSVDTHKVQSTTLVNDVHDMDSAPVTTVIKTLITDVSPFAHSTPSDQSTADSLNYSITLKQQITNLTLLLEETRKLLAEVRMLFSGKKKI
ncbi:RNA-binding protein [Reticulomyxa filosa]|uniref:RNA-binding protein n=2 Tax=Reticulomyxa filosa TaxID=46433 RepID=X6NU88_RETFI|nr:RNA-binding protein [Reticulomyxa filosa]|eukprot:ETO29581.1 RNA-binding protein [Reticulomyxa filosa]